MKAFLMHQNQDFDLDREPPPNTQALIEDLELTTLLDAMGGDDPFLVEVAKMGLLSSLEDPEAIRYRQDVLRDCLEHPSVVRDIYDIAVEAITQEKKHYGSVFRNPDITLHRSVDVLQLFVELLKRLRRVADDNVQAFRSEGFTTFFRMLTTELEDGYFDTIDEHLKRLKFRSGVLMSAQLGKGAKGKSYVLRKPSTQRPSLLERLTGGGPPAYTFTIPDRDEAGARALTELRGRGINLVANALAQSTDHILSFFTMLRCELGFHVGCLNLHERLSHKGEPISFPTVTSWDGGAFSCRGLYDVCLSLTVEQRVVGNDVDGDNKSLVMITGANQGGKSTFLRSVGLAQLMMQCGMFVPAESLAADVCRGIFTHYKREEDASMNSGKLDEELARMSEIADHISRHCLLLCNESFASTNEREGSQIAREIIRATLESGVHVFFVTHLFDLAHSLYQQDMDTALFLRAERRSDGERSFRLAEGEPLPTSYGEDVYERIFGQAASSDVPVPG